MIDPFLYDFSAWALAKNINPLSAPVGTRTLTAAVHYAEIKSWIPCCLKLQMHTEHGATFTVADLLFLCCNSCWLRAGLITVAGIALIRGVMSAIRWRKSQLLLATFVDDAEPCLREILNQVLKARLEKARVQVIQHEGAESPFCYTKCPFIVFPKTLVNQLSQTEYEAILAHEMEHIRWKDNILKQIIHVIQSLLWWLPLRKLLRSVDYSVETACDRAVEKYEIDPLVLGDSLLKTARFKKSIEHLSFCYFAGEHNIVRRVRQLAIGKRDQRALVAIQMLCMTLASIALLSARLWLF